MLSINRSAIKTANHISITPKDCDSNNVSIKINTNVHNVEIIADILPFDKIQKAGRLLNKTILMRSMNRKF